ncbi:sialate O-acetylesterase [Engelhardtia mirabilis]|uniref:Sialate O-acetylesterase domain-containing protein n=1 Tax=Engelhardtia mirabilis TaxID=2528011 RepID=A0A518BL57_9BACT|nr:hypothetical protein Pla133_27940 [Planctomycetes bacterium Pla133]QDV02032.1 hypothetical protein Pla86_27930 [Planctomycetes bacterium Pla86]
MAGSNLLDLPSIGQFPRAFAHALARHGATPRRVGVTLWGQSNMGDGGNSGPVMGRPGEPDALDERVFYLSAAGNVVPAKHPVHEIPAALAIGPGLALGKTVAQMLGGQTDVVLIPCAVGGTGFAAGDWTPGSGDEFNAAVTKINAFLALEGAYLFGFAGILGEADAAAGDAAIKAFLGNMEGFIDAVRGATYLNNDVLGGHDSKPFVMATVIEQAAGRNRINDRLRRLAATRDHYACVECTDLTDTPDSTHYAPAELRIIGSRMGAALFQAQGRQVAHPAALMPVPTPSIRIYANAATTAFADIQVEDNRNNGTPATLTNVTGSGAVGANGDDRGNCIFLNGVAAIDVNNFTLPSEGYTIAAWIAPTFTTTQNVIIVGVQNTATFNPGHEFRLLYDATSTNRYLSARTAGNAGTDGVTPLRADRWQHVAVVSVPLSGGGGGHHRLFLNGVYQGGRAQAATADRQVRIGAKVLDTSSTYIGFMDEVTFWEDALSPSQIRRHMLETAGADLPYPSI